MHQEGRAHGSVDPEHILLRHSGAILLPIERRGYPDPLDDLIGFGAVLYVMLTGKEPSGDEMRLMPAKPAVLKGPASVRASATRLAERCLSAERETAPDLQKVLTEVRLLHVMAKQMGSESLCDSRSPSGARDLPAAATSGVFMRVRRRRSSTRRLRPCRGTFRPRIHSRLPTRPSRAPIRRRPNAPRARLFPSGPQGCDLSEVQGIPRPPLAPAHRFRALPQPARHGRAPLPSVLLSIYSVLRAEDRAKTAVAGARRFPRPSGPPRSS